MKEGTSEQVGIQIETRKNRESTEIQSPNRRERLLAKEGCGFQRDICPGGENDVNPNSVEHSGQHGSRSRATGRQDCLPSWSFGGRDMHAPA